MKHPIEMILTTDDNGVVTVKPRKEFDDYLLTSIQSSDSVKKLMCDLYDLHRLPDEYTYMLALDVKLRPKHIFELSHGTEDLSILTPLSVIKRAVVTNSKHIILVHNHPSGIVTPSRFDIDVTKAIKNACELCCIQLEDHIIIADDDMYSMKKHEII